MSYRGSDQKASWPWPTPTSHPGLGPAEIHVWSATLDVQPDQIQAVSSCLDPAERLRAERFVRPRGRIRYAVARGTLRALLGRYLDADPASVAFRYGTHGKPRIDARFGRRLRFNISHSEGRALLAFALGREVGVDLELVRPDVSCEAIARRSFSSEEWQTLLASPAEGRPLLFFRCWTRKEAYVKGKGSGVSIPLDSFRVSLGDPAALLSVEGDSSETGRWRLENLDVGPSFAAALAYDGDGAAVRCFSLK